MTTAIENLSERERQVTTLCYYEELTLHEIALTLGIDGSRVSQIRASALRHLRVALSGVSLLASRTTARNNSLSAQAA